MKLASVNGCKKQAELTEQLLRYLIEKGYEGEGLIGKFKEIKPMFFSIHTAIKRSEEDIAAGRVKPAKKAQEELRRQYGL